MINIGGDKIPMSELTAIYCCKLYKAHPNKARIHAAINNPLNSELVQQISQYLDEPSKNILREAVSQKDAEREARRVEREENRSHDSNPDSDINPFHSTEPDPFFDLSGLGEPAPEPNPEPDSKPEDVSDSSDVAESVQISGEDITGATTLYSDTSEPKPDTASIAEIIKSTLNSRQDTQGVNRVLVKNQELWIHYEDSLNLNNVMAPVIEFLNSSGYPYLKFNRLARSENAIVFEICEDDTAAMSSGNEQE